MSEQAKPSSEAGKYTVHHAYQSAIGDGATINFHNYLAEAPHDPTRAQLASLKSEVEQKLAKLDEKKRGRVAPDVQTVFDTVAEVQQAGEAEITEDDKTFLETRLQNIYRMAPDIGEVLIATLANPALGVALTIRKIAQKAAEENGVSVG